MISSETAVHRGSVEWVTSDIMTGNVDKLIERPNLTNLHQEIGSQRAENAAAESRERSRSRSRSHNSHNIQQK